MTNLPSFTALLKFDTVTNFGGKQRLETFLVSMFNLGEARLL